MGDWQYGVVSKSYGGGVDDDGEEFGEDEVWSLVRDREAANSSSTSPKMKIKNKSKSKSKNKNKSRRKGGGSSAWHEQHSPDDETATMHHHHQSSSSSSSSAPVLIPDWSKIYGQGNASNWAAHHDHQDHGFEDHDGEEEVVPPHEWVARKLAGTQISSFSMCEGVGRTLKGRDLSKVRNAVLTKTGFLEQ